jgi:hypothetical protein
MDAAGNLVGTTLQGGSFNGGTAFKVSPSIYPVTITSAPNPATAGQALGLQVDAVGRTTGGTLQLFNGSTLVGTTNITPGKPGQFLFDDAETVGIGTFTLTVYFTATNPFQGKGSGTLVQTVIAPDVAMTDGTNTFSGNQTVTGSLTATSLFGNGAGILDLNPANLGAGTAGISITGNAATATVAGTLAGPTTQCGTNMFATGIATNGNANCLQPASTNLSDRATLIFNNQANVLTGGKLTLAPSAPGYASLNIPNTGMLPVSLARGDFWLTTADTHLKFVDNTNTVQSLAFLTDVIGEGSTLLGSANIFTGSNTFSQIIQGNISGNAATATTAATAATATTALTATTATTAVTAATAGSLAATPTQCGANSFATGIAANGNANCAQPVSTGQILFSSSGIPVWNGAYLGVAAPNLLESSIEQITAISGVITGVQCYLQAAPSKGGSVTFTVRVNGASTAAACTIAAGSTKGSVTGLNISFAAGNLLDILVSGNTLAPASVAIGIAP